MLQKRCKVIVFFCIGKTFSAFFKGLTAKNHLKRLWDGNFHPCCADLAVSVATILLAITTALVIWSHIWSEPIMRSMPACSSASRTLGLTPESTMWMPSFCD